jgi:hypothetical protein
MRTSLPPLPFPQLWWALLGTAAAFAISLCLLQMVQPSSLMESVVGETGEEASARTQAAVGMFHSLYHMISALMGGDDYGWATSAERVLRVAMLIIALVAGATYTANLVRMSVPRFLLFLFRAAESREKAREAPSLSHSPTSRVGVWHSFAQAAFLSTPSFTVLGPSVRLLRWRPAHPRALPNALSPDWPVVRV